MCMQIEYFVLGKFVRNKHLKSMGVYVITCKYWTNCKKVRPSIPVYATRKFIIDDVMTRIMDKLSVMQNSGA